MALVSQRLRGPLQQDEIRCESASIVTPEDMQALDAILADKVRSSRNRTSIIIDAHAVTKESYGFRVTPFSFEQLAELRPTMIVVLYTTPEVAISRIQKDAGVRPMVTTFEAGFHSALQASVAISYAISLGVPAYLLENGRADNDLLEWFHGDMQNWTR
ncbi:MAG: AAA family ATPase [Isosphaeraceae bacterium]